MDLNLLPQEFLWVWVCAAFFVFCLLLLLRRSTLAWRAALFTIWSVFLYGLMILIEMPRLLISLIVISILLNYVAENPFGTRNIDDESDALKPGWD